MNREAARLLNDTHNLGHWTSQSEDVLRECPAFWTQVMLHVLWIDLKMFLCCNW